MQRFNIRDIDFIETNNIGQIVITFKDGSNFTLRITQAINFSKDVIIVG